MCLQYRHSTYQEKHPKMPYFVGLLSLSPMHIFVCMGGTIWIFTDPKPFLFSKQGHTCVAYVWVWGSSGGWYLWVHFVCVWEGACVGTQQETHCWSPGQGPGWTWWFSQSCAGTRQYQRPGRGSTHTSLAQSHTPPPETMRECCWLEREREKGRERKWLWHQIVSLFLLQLHNFCCN